MEAGDSAMMDLALGEDAGCRERLHKAAYHGVAHALQRRPDAKQQGSSSVALALATAVGAVSANPSGLAGWLPLVAAMAATCGRETRVGHV